VAWIGNARRAPSSGDQARRIDSAMPACCNAAPREPSQSGSIASTERSALRRARTASTARNVRFQHDVMDRLLELSPARHPDRVKSVRPAAIVAIMTQARTGELAGAPGASVHRGENVAQFQLASPPCRQSGKPTYPCRSPAGQPRQWRLPPIGLTGRPPASGSAMGATTTHSCPG